MAGRGRLSSPRAALPQHIRLPLTGDITTGLQAVIIRRHSCSKPHSNSSSTANRRNRFWVSLTSQRFPGISPNTKRRLDKCSSRNTGNVMRQIPYFGFTPALLLLIPFFLSSCSPQTEKQLEDVTKQAKDRIEQLSRKAKPLQEDVKQLTDDQITRLWAVEYKTVEVSVKDATEIDSVLNEYGADRWDCYHVERAGDTWYFFFKRRKKSALRNLPYIENLQWLSFEDSVTANTRRAK